MWQERREAYSNRALKTMMITSKVKMFAIPSAKPRIIDSIPSLESCLSCQQSGIPPGSPSLVPHAPATLPHSDAAGRTRAHRPQYSRAECCIEYGSVGFCWGRGGRGYVLTIARKCLWWFQRLVLRPQACRSPRWGTPSGWAGHTEVPRREFLLQRHLVFGKHRSLGPARVCLCSQPRGVSDLAGLCCGADGAERDGESWKLAESRDVVCLSLRGYLSRWATPCVAVVCVNGEVLMLGVCRRR